MVVTTFYPMYDFASKIALDNATISVLVSAGTEPHDWEPSASDVIELEAADIFIYNDDYILIMKRNINLIVDALK